LVYLIQELISYSTFKSSILSDDRHRDPCIDSDSAFALEPVKYKPFTGILF